MLTSSSTYFDVLQLLPWKLSLLFYPIHLNASLHAVYPSLYPPWLIVKIIVMGKMLGRETGTLGDETAATKTRLLFGKSRKIPCKALTPRIAQSNRGLHLGISVSRTFLLRYFLHVKSF